MNTDQIAALTIRQLTEDDRGALDKLAQLDSNHTPDGELLGAEVEGRLLAAHSLDGDGAIADPFSRTHELRSLLELRAAQLCRRDCGDRPRTRWYQRSRAALAGSPPGAGGRLVTLRR